MNIVVDYYRVHRHTGHVDQLGMRHAKQHQQAKHPLFIMHYTRNLFKDFLVKKTEEWFGAKQSIAGPPVDQGAPSAPPAVVPTAEEVSNPLSDVSVVDATPAAQTAAEDLNVDLNEVDGSGTDGKVLVSDVKDAATSAA